MQRLLHMQVGIIPMDTFPAFVCDLADKDAVQRLYYIKDLSPAQPLSILCASFADIAAYTQGFPVASAPGQPDLFRLARQVLPGPVGPKVQAALPGWHSLRGPQGSVADWMHLCFSARSVSVLLRSMYQSAFSVYTSWGP